MSWRRVSARNPPSWKKFFHLWRFKWLEHRFTLERYVSPQELRRLADEGDARLKAFAALHLPREEMWEDVVRLTDEAIAADRELTWLIYSLYSVGDPVAEKGASGVPTDEVWEQVEKLEAYDPDNALPHLLRAHLIQTARGEAWPKLGDEDYLERLTQETEWRRAMQAAYASPRYDPYDVRRFKLERAIFQQQGWDHPGVVWFTKIMEPVPNLLFISQYARLLAGKLGPEAEAAGRPQEALDYYWQAWLFGQHMRGETNFHFEWGVGMSIQGVASESLAPALQNAGRQQEAAAVEAAGAAGRQDALRRFKHSSRASTYRNWSALWVNLSAGLVGVFLLLTLVCVLYVNGKRWIRPGKKGRLYQAITVTENYAALLLFISCLLLYASFAPYAQAFEQYMTGEEKFVELDGMYEALPVREPSLIEKLTE